MLPCPRPCPCPWFSPPCPKPPTRRCGEVAAKGPADALLTLPVPLSLAIPSRPQATNQELQAQRTAYLAAFHQDREQWEAAAAERWRRLKEDDEQQVRCMGVLTCRPPMMGRVCLRMGMLPSRRTCVYASSLKSSHAVVGRKLVLMELSTCVHAFAAVPFGAAAAPVARGVRQAAVCGGEGAVRGSGAREEAGEPKAVCCWMPATRFCTDDATVCLRWWVCRPMASARVPKPSKSAATSNYSTTPSRPVPFSPHAVLVRVYMRLAVAVARRHPRPRRWSRPQPAS